jgi:ADP-ribosyl-[dinitrogen reductase] hydrolase
MHVGGLSGSIDGFATGPTLRARLPIGLGRTGGVMLKGDDLADRVLGCVLGGAVGDALGAPFEGLWSQSIPEPSALLSDFSEFEGFPRGQYTDDTQLTVATLQSIVRRGALDPADVARSIAKLWRSQAVVGPGGACTAAADRLLAGGHWSESGAPVGQAGNGTAMRTAALGLYFLARPSDLPEASAQISRITHQDPRSIAGGVAIASASRRQADRPDIEPDALCRAIAEDIRPYHAPFADLVAGLPALLAGDPEPAQEAIAWAGSATRDFPQPIITPFVVPTVLAALWSVLRHPTSWPDAVAAAIGLGGDVDTLGAIVGGLMGARLGLAAIPDHLASTVLHASQLRALALRYAGLIERQAADEVRSTPQADCL